MVRSAFSNLLRRVRAGKSNFDAINIEKIEKGLIIKFTTIITLKKLYVGFKLVYDTGMQVFKNKKHHISYAKETPTKMRENVQK